MGKSWCYERNEMCNIEGVKHVVSTNRKYMPCVRARLGRRFNEGSKLGGFEDECRPKVKLGRERRKCEKELIIGWHNGVQTRETRERTKKRKKNR